MSDSEQEDNQWEMLQHSNVKRGMLVSGWDDPDDLIIEDTNPNASHDRKLLWAVNENKIDLIREVLAECPNSVNAKDDDGYTPLHRACYNNNIEIAMLLLEYNADTEARTEYGWTPLHSACQWSNAECVALLLQHNADVNARTQGDQTPLHIAASVSNCRNTASTLLMDHRINPDLKNNSNETAADIARRVGLTFPIFQMGHKALQVKLGRIDELINEVTSK